MKLGPFLIYHGERDHKGRGNSILGMVCSPHSTAMLGAEALEQFNSSQTVTQTKFYIFFLHCKYELMFSCRNLKPKRCQKFYVKLLNILFFQIFLKRSNKCKLGPGDTQGSNCQVSKRCKIPWWPLGTQRNGQQASDHDKHVCQYNMKSHLTLEPNLFLNMILLKKILHNLDSK